MVGQTISHYRILEKLGGGGMGVVYKAVDVRLNRFVALKFLSPDLTKDPDANARFMQEAQAASALDHPNICTIHEIDETPDKELFLTLAYYDGETLKERIERGRLPIEEAVDIAIQIAQALSVAHEAGIVHRDIKPANVMIGKDGLVKILDFGLAKLAGRTDLTRTGTTLGTIAYMSPEQIRGGEFGAGTDVWSLGVVLYEMLAGRRPFEARDDLAVISAILDDTPPPIGKLRDGLPSAVQRIVSRALDKDAALRYRSATELLKDLTASRTAMRAPPAGAGSLLHLLRRPSIAIPAAAIVIAAGIAAVIAYRRSTRARWVHEDAIPQIARLVETDNYGAAFALASQVERVVPNDPTLAGLWPRFSVPVSITTAPDGAEVSIQDYAASDDSWTPIGRTPIQGVKLPRGVFRVRLEKPGFETYVLSSANPGTLLQSATNRLAIPITFSLPPNGSHAGMVPVLGGAFPVSLIGFATDRLIPLDPFVIDRYEVTNQAYKRFVDAGGYAKAEYWSGQDATTRFRDSSDRPGPAAWELGAYPAGQDEYPVGGLSWFEAAAYCRSQGKTLPTLFHWARAALSPDELFAPLAPAIIPLSNFGNAGPAPVGSHRGVGPYGTFDMGGNVREWVWNESSGGRHWILGGGWNDPEWMLIQRNSLGPFDRSATNGFRCAQYGTGTTVPDTLLERVEILSRDNRTARAVSDEVLDVFIRQYTYPTPALNERIESTDTSQPDWVRETISFDAGSDNRRVTAYVFLPRTGAPPYQAVVFFPGLSSFVGRSSSANLQPGLLDFVVRSGRVVVWPVYSGSYERWDPAFNLQGDDLMRAMRTRMFEWREELGRVLDLLSARKDIDSHAFAYFGGSFGASMPIPLLALEHRLKTAVLLAPGFTGREMPPEADAVNYVKRVTLPVLMLGGRHDYVLPLEESQKPLFERLGTPANQKRHVVFEAGHASDFPRSQVIREVLGWLDRYLGPASKPAGTTSP